MGLASAPNRRSATARIFSALPGVPESTRTYGPPGSPTRKAFTILKEIRTTSGATSSPASPSAPVAAYPSRSSRMRRSTKFMNYPQRARQDSNLRPSDS